jgi:hypothetical protein
MRRALVLSGTLAHRADKFAIINLTCSVNVLYADVNTSRVSGIYFAWARSSELLPLGMGSIARFSAGCGCDHDNLNCHPGFRRGDTSRGFSARFPASLPLDMGYIAPFRSPLPSHRGTTGRPTQNTIGLNFEFSCWTPPPPKGGIASPAPGTRRSRARRS